MKKRNFSLLMAMTLVVAMLAGCGAKEEIPAADAAVTEEKTEAKEESAAEEEPAAEATALRLRDVHF